MANARFYFIKLAYIIVSTSLLLYSFTQVDLGLTLTRLSIWQIIQKSFQGIGYFDRPLSTTLYGILIAFLFLLYHLTLSYVEKNRLEAKELFRLILIISGILVFSYNAFSYDLFNYIFDAKIFTYYHQNPYVHKALDFPGEPMLAFMHWTHRVYPYGPVWLGITVPLSFLGFHLFLPTVLLFKLLAAASFLGTVVFIGKILKSVLPKNEVLGIVFFALNPLVIIESLVSGHNDIVMMFFSLASFYFLIKRNYFLTFILLAISIGIKFATIFLLPIFLYVMFLQIKKRKTDWEFIFTATAVVMLLPVIIAAFRTNFQPWYLLYVLPFASFIGNKYYVLIPTIIISLFSLFLYMPFLYTGNWDPPIPTILWWITISGIGVSLLLTFGVFFRKKIHRKQ